VEAGAALVFRHSGQSPVADSTGNGREHRIQEPAGDTEASREGPSGCREMLPTVQILHKRHSSATRV
jgi:hypothetical protein